MGKTYRNQVDIFDRSSSKMNKNKKKKKNSRSRYGQGTYDSAQDEDEFYEEGDYVPYNIPIASSLANID